MFPDAREALKDLLNLSNHSNPERPRDKATTFISRHGSLRPFEFPAYLAVISEGIKGDHRDPGVAVLTLSALFSATLTMSGKAEDVQLAINTVLDNIFKLAQIDGREQPSAHKVDILTRTVHTIPRDLLDAVAVEFMRSYKNIERCDRCRRFFFKDYARDRYCSRPCAEQSRSEAQRDWMRKYRAEQKCKPAAKSKRRRTA